MVRLNYNCPYCKAYSNQDWYRVLESVDTIDKEEISAERDRILSGAVPPTANTRTIDFLPSSLISSGYDLPDLRIAKCTHCDKYTIWYKHKMIVPRQLTTSPPNEDLPDRIKDLYIEASEILNESPRSSAGLLRLVVQELCDHLNGKKVNNINDYIGKLVKRGLDPRVQEALDLCRVTGNHAVHLGSIAFDDRSEVANQLFEIVNFIAEKMITEPNRVEKQFSKILPQTEKDKIAKRDS